MKRMSVREGGHGDTPLRSSSNAELFQRVQLNVPQVLSAGTIQLLTVESNHTLLGSRPHPVAATVGI